MATEFVQRAVASHTDKPVMRMPMPLREPQPSTRDRRSFGLADEAYTFLFTFDCNSVVERKNPLGVATAFKTAFPTASAAAHLVLKSVNADRWPAEMEELRAAISDRTDITLLDGYLETDDQAALLAVSDCYVSLHRSEGLGLTMADAMALGKPVIATRCTPATSISWTTRTACWCPSGTRKCPAGSPPIRRARVGRPRR